MSGEMKPIRPIDSLISGFVAGLVSAFLGIVLMSVILAGRQAVIEKSFAPDSFRLFFITMIISFIIIALPAGIGGAVLGLVLHVQNQKQKLSLKIATWTGVLIAGLIAVILCGFGILAIMFGPHNYWYLFLKSINEGTYSGNLIWYLQRYMYLANKNIFEMITVTTIACIAGGLAGRHLAKKFLALKTDLPV
jgi:hypothetical protein